jgi:hypothetical protein
LHDDDFCDDLKRTRLRHETIVSLAARPRSCSPAPPLTVIT